MPSRISEKVKARCRRPSCLPSRLSIIRCQQQEVGPKFPRCQSPCSSPMCDMVRKISSPAAPIAQLDWRLRDLSTFRIWSHPHSSCVLCGTASYSPIAPSPYITRRLPFEGYFCFSCTTKTQQTVQKRRPEDYLVGTLQSMDV